MTFEPGAGALDPVENTWTEAGMTVKAYGLPIAALFVPGAGAGGSTALNGVWPTDVIFYVPGHTFNLTGFVFGGGGPTRIDGSINGVDYVGGPAAILSGLGHVFPPSELADWHDLYAVKHCSYCMTSFIGVYLDNITFDVNAAAVPVPPALPLFASGLGVLGWAARRKKKPLAG